MGKNSSHSKILYGISGIGVGIILIFCLSIYFDHSSTENEGSDKEYNNPIDTLSVDGLKVIDFEYWVSIQEDFWWRYAYRLWLRNDSDREKVVKAEIKYFNSNGAVIDSATTNIIRIPAGEERRSAGHSLIGLPDAREVKRAEVVIRSNNIR